LDAALDSDSIADNNIIFDQALRIDVAVTPYAGAW
jgi:hypothetical protein